MKRRKKRGRRERRDRKSRGMKMYRKEKGRWEGGRRNTSSL